MVNIRSTQLVQSYDKSKQAMSSVVRSTSCNRGWLRLVVQGTFGFIIVSSFILIVRLTICVSSNPTKPENRRCVVETCRVICHDAPMYGDYEDDIVYAVGETGSNCGRVFIRLNRPMFIDSSMPSQWLSAIRINVEEIEMVGGNLQHISPESFMSQFGGNLRILVLTNITLNAIGADTFLGLTNLQELHVVDGNVKDVQKSSLQAVDDTLEILKIRLTEYWDPVNVTGSTNLPQLRVVDLSNNQFHRILRNGSFSGLEHCKVLYLSWCKISAIGAGTLDSLKSIEILHLNNNNLVTLPPDLFNKLVPLEPRISLQGNPWHCDCSNQNLRILTKLSLLIVDPTCRYPPSYRGLSFSEFERQCNNYPLAEIVDEDLYIFSGESDTNTLDPSVTNLTSRSNNDYVYINSPVPEYKCKKNKTQRVDSKTFTDGLSVDNHWLSPTFFVETNKLSMISLSFMGSHHYGLIWFQSSNANEIYCINRLPNSLKIFYVDPSIQYTFCRVSAYYEPMTRDECVVYDLSSLQTSPIVIYKSILLFICIAITGLITGALCIYALIHTNPILLKGSKRVVFVKHKTVDALILPPKIPLRCDVPDDSIAVDGKISNIFLIPESKKSLSDNFLRTNSMKTTESNNPSYISALQPTEDQLAEWRTTRQLEIKCTYDSLETNPSTSHYESLPYYSFDSSEKIYDTIKI